MLTYSGAEMNRRVAVGLVACVGVAALALHQTDASAVPFELTQQGRLFDSAGAPLTGAHTLGVFLYDAPAGGSVVWSEDLQIEFDEGYYSVVLGKVPGNNLDTSLFDAPVYTGLSVDGGPSSQRFRVTSVPYAFIAEKALNVEGGVVDASEIRINGTVVIDEHGAFQGEDSLRQLDCSTGQVAEFTGVLWECADPSTLTEGDVVSIIEGGPLSLAAGSSIGGDTVAGGDHFTASDAVLAVEAGAITLSAGSTLAGDTISTGAHFSGADAVAAVEAATITLSSGSTLAGDTISTGSHFGSSDAIAAVEAGSIDLASGSTLNGDDLVTNTQLTQAVSGTATSDKQDEVIAKVDTLMNALMPASCPSGMFMAGKAGTETAVCVETAERSAAYYDVASVTCGNLGRHVCTRGQWWAGYNTGEMSSACGNWEWTGSQDHGRNGEGFLQITVGAGNCPWQTSWSWSGQHNNRGGPNAYRCCTGGTSTMFD